MICKYLYIRTGTIKYAVLVTFTVVVVLYNMRVLVKTHEKRTITILTSTIGTMGYTSFVH